MDEVLESIEGIRVMRAYSKRDQQVKQFQKKTASLSKNRGQNCFYPIFFGPLALLFIGFSTILSAIWRTVPKVRQLSLALLALQLYLVSFNWAYVDDGGLDLGLPDRANVL